MNKNPLLVKSSLLGKIPFMKEKTLSLYRRYISDRRLSKAMSADGNSETLSAFTLNSRYPLNDTSPGLVEPVEMVFDLVDVTQSEFFSEKEWIGLGMLLRAYSEVENIKLMHLYNCLYSSEGNTIRGFIVTGRTYTLYSYTQLPVKLSFYGVIGGVKPDAEVMIQSLSGKKPYVFVCPTLGSEIEKIIEIKIEFTGKNSQQSTLVEGLYPGVTYRSLSDWHSHELVPENLGIGEYSNKLVEFFAGTLVTPLSDSKLISNLGQKLPGTGSSVWENVIENTKGIYNQDGYLDRRSKI